MRTFDQRWRLRVGALLAVGLSMAAGPAAGQRPTMEEARAIREACRVDYETLCAGVPMGNAALECLAKNAAQTSPACQQALRAAKGGGASPVPSASPSAAQAAPAATPSTAAGKWPHTVQGERGSAVVYQPQVIAWPDRQKLETRAAVAITPTGAKTASYGTIDVSFATATDLASRTVTLSQPQLVAVRFPTLANEQTAAIEERVRTTLAGLGSKTVPLDMVVASLRDSGEKPPSVELKNDPPAICVSARPASLIVFDGEPVLTPI